MLLAATDYPLLNVFWTTFLIFGWVLWFWLLIRMYSDVFGRRDIGGWAKTGWVVLSFVLPILGVLIYLITQSRGMAERSERQMRQAQAETEEYIRSVAAGADTASVEQARGLLDSGAITPQEYERLVGTAPR